MSKICLAVIEWRDPAVRPGSDMRDSSRKDVDSANRTRKDLTDRFGIACGNGNSVCGSLIF